MKIVVLIKETPDTEAKISISGDGSELGFGTQKPIVNPYDEFAVEAAVSLKEKIGGDCEVIVAAYGPASVKERMMRALAMGGDRGVLIEALPSPIDSVCLAQLFAALVRKEGAELVWCGKQGIDNDNMHMVPMLGEVLGWGHVNVVGALEWDGTDGFNSISREVDGGQVEKYQAKLPLVLGANKSLNKPRYAPLPKVLQAKKKPFEMVSVADLGFSEQGLTSENFTEILNYFMPEEKPAGKIIDGDSLEAKINSLVQLLHDEAKVI